MPAPPRDDTPEHLRAAVVERLADAPPLTSEQSDRLRLLLTPIAAAVPQTKAS
jgi:hypothetical protein